ncbi:MAG: hypothetical protein AABO58_21790 [Acidobacteriota bacterium]
MQPRAASSKGKQIGSPRLQPTENRRWPQPATKTASSSNCPLDDVYRQLFEAVVFAVHDCGYIARCALEVDDASEVRIEKIAKIIASCKFGIHDISRTELDAGTDLPRFNMPLELGLFLGAKRFGRAE